MGIEFGKEVSKTPNVYCNSAIVFITINQDGNKKTNIGYWRNIAKHREDAKKYKKHQSSTRVNSIVRLKEWKLDKPIL